MQSQDVETVQQRFNAQVQPGLDWGLMSGVYNGFSRPHTPIIAQDNCEMIIPAQWGLIPHWADFQTFKANTLNARIETLDEKPTFSPYILNRCLVFADGFFEWKWIDAQGKRKEKYLIRLPEGDLFAFAGIYSQYVIPSTGEVVKTYSIITTAANALMAEIHNTKKRMPIILTTGNERQWLDNEHYLEFKTCDVELVAKRVEHEG